MKCPVEISLLAAAVTSLLKRVHRLLQSCYRISTAQYSNCAAEKEGETFDIDDFEYLVLSSDEEDS